MTNTSVDSKEKSATVVKIASACIIVVFVGINNYVLPCGILPHHSNVKLSSDGRDLDLQRPSPRNRSRQPRAFRLNCCIVEIVLRSNVHLCYCRVQIRWFWGSARSGHRVPVRLVSQQTSLSFHWTCLKPRRTTWSGGLLPQVPGSLPGRK